MRVALVHDWLTGTRGGEKVLLEAQVRMCSGRARFHALPLPSLAAPRDRGPGDPHDLSPAGRFAALRLPPAPPAVLLRVPWSRSISPRYDLVVSSRTVWPRAPGRAAGACRLSTATRPSATPSRSSSTRISPRRPARARERGLKAFTRSGACERWDHKKNRGKADAVPRQLPPPVAGAVTPPLRPGGDCHSHPPGWT